MNSRLVKVGILIFSGVGGGHMFCLPYILIVYTFIFSWFGAKVPNRHVFMLAQTIFYLLVNVV